MLFTWSAECALDDPLLVVPWYDPDGPAHFVDLRADPYATDEIAEALEYPALAQALRSLNAARSPVFTAKCDAWAIADHAELRALAAELMLGEAADLTGFSGYIDLVWRDRTVYASFHRHQHLMHRLERRLAALPDTDALTECVIRPALVDFDAPHEGFAVTCYVKAVGADASAAESAWARALAGIVLTLRSRDLLPHTAGLAMR